MGSARKRNEREMREKEGEAGKEIENIKDNGQSPPLNPPSGFPIYTLRDLVACLSDEHGREKEMARASSAAHAAGNHHYFLGPPTVLLLSLLFLCSSYPFLIISPPTLA